MYLKADWVPKNTPGKTAADWTWDNVAANNVAAAVNSTGPVVATIADLKNTSGGYAHAAGYWAVGDGGGGLFRWDSSDTTSPDNGGTIITPNGGLAATGRWKRVYEGECNARWFGVSTSQADNTAQLQAAVDWLSSRTYPDSNGVLFIPQGWYAFKFDAGTSGLSTITIAEDGITIRGEGVGTFLMVTDHARPNQLDYFFSIVKPSHARGQGGGIKDLRFYGNSMLKWCVYLGCWRNAEFSHISVMDVHSGFLDGEANNTTVYGENIRIQDIDYTSSDGTCATQYGIRFRAGHDSNTNTWSDCYIINTEFICCWDAGIVLDCVQRFRVLNTCAANNLSLTNTIDGNAKVGCLNAVRVTNTAPAGKSGAGNGGYHQIDGVYLESGEGSETPATNVGVLVEVPVDQEGWVTNNHVYNVWANDPVDCAQVLFVDRNGYGRAVNNIYHTAKVASIISAAAPAYNISEICQLNITAQAEAITSMTSGMTGSPYDGQKLIITIKDDGSPRAITWDTAFLSSGIATLLATTVASQTHTIGLIYSSAAGKWVCVAVDETGY